LESQFNVDLNSDLRIGAPVNPIETQGSVALVQIGSNYGLYGKDGSGNPTSGPLLKMSGSAVTVGQFGSWAPLHAESNGSGYIVLWHDSIAGTYSKWFVDANGNFASVDSTLGSVSLSSPLLWTLESQFNVDLNSDLRVGAPPPTTIETSGSVALMQVGSNYGLYPKDGGGNPTIGPILKFNGQAVTIGQFEDWSPIGAESAPSGYKVLFRNA
jgi:serralysin